MKFTKMHGCGNDYVYVNCFEETVEDPCKTAIYVSDRHFGIGSDGLILIKPSKIADFQMDMYNLDGSRGKMCGNGIRCVAKYVYDFGLTDKTEITVETGSGVKTLQLFVENGKVQTVRVNMGAPELTAENIPVALPEPCAVNEADAEAGATGKRETRGAESAAKRLAIDEPIEVQGKTWRFTGVSMGNPHAVVFLDDSVTDILEFPLEEIGPHFENHAYFPDRVNTEFIKVLDDTTIQMRVWERGSGETWACGTGACASDVASILNQKVKGTKVHVKLRGGDLDIEWDRAANLVYMTGPATTVFSGEIEIP